MNTISITYQPPPLSCEFMSIDKLDEDISFLAELLDSFTNLTAEQRERVNNALKQIAKTHRRIDDDDDERTAQYNTADKERDELWDELQALKAEASKLKLYVEDAQYLEIDLYSAIAAARQANRETASVPLSVLDRAHQIIEQLQKS